MSEIFNKYGNPSLDGPLADLEKTIDDTVRDYIDKAIEMGATVVELRALAYRLSGVVSCNFSPEILKMQCEMRKKEKDKDKFRNFYVCPRCNSMWDSIGACTCDDKCPKCNLSVSPDISEDYK